MSYIKLFYNLIVRNKQTASKKSENRLIEAFLFYEFSWMLALLSSKILVKK